MEMDGWWWIGGEPRALVMSRWQGEGRKGEKGLSGQ